MTTHIKSIDDVPISLYDALKRGVIKRGHIPRHAINKTEKDSPEEHIKKLDELAHSSEKSSDVLFKAESVFPFTLFPDTVILDRDKITVIERRFFKVASTSTIRVEDILSSDVNVGPFFGSVQVVPRVFTYQMSQKQQSGDEPAPATIKYLWKHDALRLNKLVNAYIIARLKKIDSSNIPVKKLTELLYEIGKSEPGAE
jgi:hypothetical protein